MGLKPRKSWYVTLVNTTGEERDAIFKCDNKRYADKLERKFLAEVNLGIYSVRKFKR